MARGKKEEFNFRDLTSTMLLIRNDKNLRLIKEKFKHESEDDAMLVYGYIDHSAGVTFEVLCIAKYNDDGEIALREGDPSISFKLRYNSVEGEIILLNTVIIEGLQDKVDMIEQGYKVNPAVIKARNTQEFDSFRHPQFPDDVMLHFIKKGCRPEGIWCRIEKESNGKLAAKLLNEPHVDFGVHCGEIVEFECVKHEERLIGVARLSWMEAM